MHGHIDHLVLAVANLEEAIETMDTLLGVRPAMGGRHPGWGTWNALVSLGGSSYLELIAPDPENRESSVSTPEIFSTPSAARMIGWFAKCRDLDAAREILVAKGACPGPVKDGSRALPDGRLLQWQLTDPETMVMDGIFPMLIDWQDSPHPSASAPTGCRLVEFSLVHPNASKVQDLMNSIGIDQVVQAGPSPAISATFETPVGRFEWPL